MRICRRDLGALLMGALASRLVALPTRPKLLVLVVLGQFRPDYIDDGWPQFGQGGLRRLLTRGAYFPDCRNLASSFPASGLATLATGAWPAQHGIVADTWYDAAARRTVAASDESLLATTLAAQVAAAPGTRVSVVSLSATQARLFAGTPEAKLYWMDDEGRFATTGDSPEWLAAFNGQNRFDTARDARWMALGAKPDGPPLRVLTYDSARPRNYSALYRSSPFGETALFDFLGELISRERLGQGEQFDFVCLLDQSTELLGYETGAHSPLMQQMTLQLDRRLETLLAQLNLAPGDGAFDLVLAGAHGAPPDPPAQARHRMTVNGEALAQAVERHLFSNASGHVEKYVYPFFYLDASGFRDPEPVRLAAGRAALEYPGVAGFFTAGGAASVHDAWSSRFRNSFHVRRSGDVMLSYRAEYVEDTGLNRGVSYGSLYNYDIRVPLCFFGPQFRAGVFETPVESVDIAPTLARAMGLAVPSSTVGRVLGEAFAESEITTLK